MNNEWRVRHIKFGRGGNKYATELERTLNELERDGFEISIIEPHELGTTVIAHKISQLQPLMGVIPPSGVPWDVLDALFSRGTSSDAYRGLTDVATKFINGVLTDLGNVPVDKALAKVPGCVVTRCQGRSNDQLREITGSLKEWVVQHRTEHTGPCELARIFDAVVEQVEKQVQRQVS